MTNLKLVLRTYSALRQMSPDDIALLETLRGLNDGDRELMVEALQGKATTKKAGKKSTSKSSQSSSKSPRASGIHAQLKERRQEQRDKTTTITDDGHCIYELSYGPCLQAADANIHHLRNHPHHHEFVEGKSSAPPAPAPSPVNGGATNGAVSSEIEKDAVSNAVRAGG